MGEFCQTHTQTMERLAKYEEMTTQQGVNILKIFEKLDKIEDDVKNVRTKIEDIRVEMAQLMTKAIIITASLVGTIVGIVSYFINLK
jgi:ABC-type enterochelin transport system substrate-binding protein